MSLKENIMSAFGLSKKEESQSDKLEKLMENIESFWEGKERPSYYVLELSDSSQQYYGEFELEDDDGNRLTDENGDVIRFSRYYEAASKEIAERYANTFKGATGIILLAYDLKEDYSVISVDGKYEKELWYSPSSSKSGYSIYDTPSGEKAVTLVLSVERGEYNEECPYWTEDSVLVARGHPDEFKHIEKIKTSLTPVTLPMDMLTHP
jgi:hypothetical protein